MDAMRDVDVVPMFCPKIMGMALPQVTRPVLESACKMPTDAEELCTATVTSVPARTPRMGFCSVVNRRTNSSDSRSVLTESVIMPMPMNSKPKPMKIWPMSRLRGDLMNTNSTAPTNARMGANVAGLRNSISMPPPEISESRMIWPVTVVPMLAPMMMPMAWESCMMPELTRPTTMTVVPELDWMSAVMTAPRATARQVDEVSFCRMLSILPPAYFSSPVPMMDMPYKNSARPPAKLITLKMVIHGLRSLPTGLPYTPVVFTKF